MCRWLYNNLDVPAEVSGYFLRAPYYWLKKVFVNARLRVATNPYSVEVQAVIGRFQ
jgi:hypothetical protein